MNSLGQRLRTLRRLRKLTQKQLANRVGIIEATLSKYENGQRDSKWEILSKLADELDTNTDYLLGRTDLSVPSQNFKLGDGLNPEDIELLLKYHKLSDKHKAMVTERIDTLLEDENRE